MLDVVRDLDDLQYRQLPCATMLAINNTAVKVADAERHEMGDKFKHPTPYTMGSVGRTYAKKQGLVASVFIKNSAAGATPASKFLASEIDGGARRMKRFEVALQAVGVLPSGYRVVPGAAAKLDSYGNMDRGQILQILAYFKAFPEMGFKNNLSDKKKEALARGNKRTGTAGFVYFVGRPANGRLPLGVWQRFTLAHGSAIKPVMIFVPHAAYKKLFGFFTVGHQVIDRELIGEMKRATAEALRTAR